TMFERGVAPYAEGSCLISFGATRVLCTASVEEGVPAWKRGSGEGWLTAEYAMLPRATRTRTARERAQLGGRTQEIQRLIGRSVRGVDGEPRLDLDYEEDVRAEVDMNVVMSNEGKFVEVQGTGEHGTFDRRQLDELLALAIDGIRTLDAAQANALSE